MSRIPGSVKFFNSQKGYGFILAQDDAEDSGKEYFVHFSAISGDGFKSLASGEEVEFELETNPTTGKQCAVNVTGPSGAMVKGAPPQAMKGGGKGGGKGGKGKDGGFGVANYQQKGDKGFGKSYGGKGFSGGGGGGGSGEGFGGKGKGGGFKGKGKSFDGGYNMYGDMGGGGFGGGYGGGGGGGYGGGYNAGGYGGGFDAPAGGGQYGYAGGGGYPSPYPGNFGGGGGQYNYQYGQ